MIKKNNRRSNEFGEKQSKNRCKRETKYDRNSKVNTPKKKKHKEFKTNHKTTETGHQSLTAQSIDTTEMNLKIMRTFQSVSAY